MNIFKSKSKGILFVVSGPSGSGKTTLCNEFSEIDSNTIYAISATTRNPRNNEKNGINYFFMNKKEFEDNIKKSSFLEYAEVHGNYYGTLKSEIINHIENNKDVLIDIDVQGAKFIKKSLPPNLKNNLVFIFVCPENNEELIKRLSLRATETKNQLNLRISNSHKEIKEWQNYNYIIISTSKKNDLDKFKSIINAERCKLDKFSLNYNLP